ncbi:MAG: hypothetical protein Q7R73_03095 [bacterium]|nr:hypothetical protein [bacterium]
MLDTSIRLVTFQFSFSNRNEIPRSVPEMGEETPDEYLERKSRSGGVILIEPTHNCSLAMIPAELQKEDYQLVTAGWKKRSNFEEQKNSEQERGPGDTVEEITSKIWYMTRFRYARSEHAYPRPEFLQKRDAILADFDEMCWSTLWRLRAFLNQAYLNGELLKGQSAISINLEVRKPRFNPDGTPVITPLKDAEGMRIGSEPLQVEHYFSLL